MEAHDKSFGSINWLYICISGISAELPFFYPWFSSQDSTSADHVGLLLKKGLQMGTSSSTEEPQQREQEVTH